jgi:hypothetical protein
VKRLLLALTLSLASSACAVPLGPYGLRPEALFNHPREAADSAIPACPAGGAALVIKRFDSRALTPVGAFFYSTKGDLERMAQTYAPEGELEVPLFESTVDALRSAGCVAWKDYSAQPEALRGPPGASEYIVVHAVVEELEIDTFGAAQPEDAARTRITFAVQKGDGKPLPGFEVNTGVRIARSDGDVLRALGRKVAAQIVIALQGSPGS